MANMGLTIVGEATDGVEALQMWRDLKGPPDLVNATRFVFTCAVKAVHLRENQAAGPAPR